MEFVDCLLISYADEVVVDDDLEKPNNSCRDDIPFEKNLM
jgi:hypothetical protein